MMKARLTNNMGLKAVSILLGFSLWYAVAREQDAEFALSIPIELRDLPDGLEVIGESVQQVEVRLRGPAEILRRLTPQDMNIGVELSDAEPGERLAYLTPRDVSAPFAARVMRVTPTSVKIDLDRTLEKTVAVIPRVVGAPAEGFEIHHIELAPREIVIVGPASRVEGLEQATTQPVSADGLREPYSRVVRVELDPLVRLARETTVELTIDVREEHLRREFSNVALKTNPGDVKARLSPSKIRVVLDGPKSAVSVLTAEDIEAEVYLESLPPGRHTLAPTISVASPEVAQIEVVAVKPEQISVRIQ
jgi:YbbR domain-containing protein